MVVVFAEHYTASCYNPRHHTHIAQANTHTSKHTHKHKHIARRPPQATAPGRHDDRDGGEPTPPLGLHRGGELKTTPRRARAGCGVVFTLSPAPARVEVVHPEPGRQDERTARRPGPPPPRRRRGPAGMQEA